MRGYNALDLIHEAIYEGRPVGRRLGTAAQDFLRAQQAASSYLNVLKSMIDTVVARNGKRRAMPVIGCENASYTEKRYARRSSGVLRRKMGQPRVERMLPMQMRDAVVRGDGFVEAFRSGGDIAVERFPRSELVFDDGEARGGDWPRTIARVKLVDRDQLCAMYPEEADRIRKVQPAARDIWSPYDWDAPIDPDQVEVVRGWRLPSLPGDDDGCYVVAIRDGGKPLRERPWKRSRFPFARVQWTPAMRGFLGIGLIQELAGSQNKVNELWEDHQLALHWASQLTIFLPRGSNVDKHHLRGRDPKVVEFDGVAPQYIAPDPASKQAMDSLRWLIQQMYEISGVSQSAAASKNPLGPNASGKALDTFYDIESDRFSQFELQYAMGRVDVGQIILDEAQDLATDADEDDDDDVDLAPWIEEIDWKRFDFDSGNYHLNIEPKNFIPDERGGRLDTLQDMAKIPGLLTNPLVTASLFEEPDIAGANRHLLGPIRMLQKVMEMLGEPDYQVTCVPTPYMLAVKDLAKEMALGELGNAFAEGATDDELEPFRWFLKMLEGEATAAMPSPMPGPQPPMPGPGPIPGPGAPPPPGAAMPPPGPPPLVPDTMGGLSAQAAAGMAPPNIIQHATMLPPGFA